MRAERTESRPAGRPLSEVPWTVWSFAVVDMVGFIVLTLFDGVAVDAAVDIVPFLMNAVLVVGIVLGYRAAWIVAVIYASVAAVGAVGLFANWFGGDLPDFEELWAAIAYVVSTAFLIHPLTRAWANR